MLLGHIILRGRVQDVGFRMFIKDLGNSMGLTGEVWNNYDGTLEVNAYSSNREFLNKFFEKIKEGPTYASISKTNITITASDPYLKDEFVIHS